MSRRVKIRAMTTELATSTPQLHAAYAIGYSEGRAKGISEGYTKCEVRYLHRMRMKDQQLEHKANEIHKLKSQLKLKGSLLSEARRLLGKQQGPRNKKVWWDQ